jgi:hypothetical protein
MRPLRPLLRWLAPCVGLALVVQIVGCGTLLYPERHGRRGGRVDPGVLIMDGVLLFFFVVPGLVAYAIDFYTGAVYVSGTKRTAVLFVDPAELTDERLETILSVHAGREVHLDDPRGLRFERSADADPSETLAELRRAARDPDWRPSPG